jgi:SagB-type dehydrogenase family enzyme
MSMTDDDLDETTFPAWRDAIASHAHEPPRPRSYPGYPRTELPRARTALLGGPSLPKVLAARRASGPLGDALPPVRAIGHVLELAHGITGDDARGPTPSAGGLQALELYLVSWAPGWLAPGWYHYDRAGHALAEVRAGADRAAVAAVVPSLELVRGGALCTILAGDHARVAARYGKRAQRFLLLEAGHLMQNLCLAAHAAKLCTIPLGGFYERALARALQLPRTDRVLYAGVVGELS